MFKITDRKGFHMTFENGYTISVQFGRGNYSENYDFPGYREDVPPSLSAEVAVWNCKGDFVCIEDGSEVAGWCSTEKVADIIQQVRSMK